MSFFKEYSTDDIITWRNVASRRVEYRNDNINGVSSLNL
jgi:hypothetical protein